MQRIIIGWLLIWMGYIFLLGFDGNYRKFVYKGMFVSIFDFIVCLIELVQ